MIRCISGPLLSKNPPISTPVVSVCPTPKTETREDGKQRKLNGANGPLPRPKRAEMR